MIERGPGPQSQKIVREEGEWLAPGIQRLATLAGVAMSTGQGCVLEDADGQEYLDVESRTDEGGQAILGVMHSHTHTTAYPSPTDVAEASKPLIPPDWHWVIVSLAWGFPELHSFKIFDGGIAEEPVVLSQ